MAQKFKIALFAGVALAAISFTPAHAAQSYDLDIHYEIYTGGIHAMSATLGMEMDQKDYTVDMVAKPHGTIGKLLPWQGEYQSTGLVKKDHLQPVTFSKNSSWRDKTKRTTLEYDKNGALTDAKYVGIKDGVKTDAYDHAFTHDLVVDTVDLMTATVDMLKQVNQGKTCDTSIPVFDGKRRFNMVFRQTGTQTMIPSRLNKFKGEAIKCTVEIEPIAGWEKKKRGYFRIQEQSKAKGYLPTVWIGRAYDGGPMVPIRMEIKSEYGAILMHYQNATQKPEKTALAN